MIKSGSSFHNNESNLRKFRCSWRYYKSSAAAHLFDRKWVSKNNDHYQHAFSTWLWGDEHLLKLNAQVLASRWALSSAIRGLYESHVLVDCVAAHFWWKYSILCFASEVSDWNFMTSSSRTEAIVQGVFKHSSKCPASLGNQPVLWISQIFCQDDRVYLNSLELWREKPVSSKKHVFALFALINQNRLACGPFPPQAFDFAIFLILVLPPIFYIRRWKQICGS